MSDPDQGGVPLADQRGRAPARHGFERVRHELLTALHFGKLTPGDRVPSVRRLAALTGMNRKTVHRAYTRLAAEGLLEMRPGSGTFIAEQLGGPPGTASMADLLIAVNRCRSTAERLGLAPGIFGSFVEIVLGGGLRGLPVTLVECNHEHLGLIERELREAVGLEVRPVLLSGLAAAARAVSAETRAVVTTDCHAAEVAEIVAPLGLPVHRVALDPVLPQRLVDLARRGPVVMVVRDRRFAPGFLRLLRQLTVPDEVLQRFQIVEPRQARSLLSEIPGQPTLCISPLAGHVASRLGAVRARRVEFPWRLETSSLERLKVALALEVASRHRPCRSRAG